MYHHLEFKYLNPFYVDSFHAHLSRMQAPSCSYHSLFSSSPACSLHVAPILANMVSCRGLGATYANGWLIMVGASRMSPVPGSGIRRRHVRRRTLPRLGALRGDNTPTPALRGLRMITRSTRSYKRLLELFGGRRKKGKASSLLSLW